LASHNNPAKRFSRDVERQPTTGVIVEEEERLGVVRQDVVDAHCDEIEADRCMLAARLRNLKTRVENDVVLGRQR